ncbi:MAG: ABC transporter ATP-binding protein [candidate division Zixibacteria bacterium]|jgi:ABC-2 type transport system ATP-binding protein|nr:ABC transporter ATP-binding protein [candidate division Zixibacteria bacterium]
MIKCTQLTKKYGNYSAVDNLNLEIKPGELFAFLGPNGAGKTTTIKMMTGILKPTSGKVEIAGIDIQEKAGEAKMKIGYVPDTPYLYERLTAREFMEFIGGLYRLDPDIIRRRSYELFTLFDMNGWVDRKCEQYSHGMRQKLVFAAAMIHFPTVLIVDEPMVGLDPHSAKLVKDLLKDYVAKGNTVFVSTHILSIAEELCDRVGIINKGRLIAVGSIGELKSAANKHDANLESLFLSLTGQPE